MAANQPSLSDKAKEHLQVKDVHRAAHEKLLHRFSQEEVIKKMEATEKHKQTVQEAKGMISAAANEAGEQEKKNKWEKIHQTVEGKKTETETKQREAESHMKECENTYTEAEKKFAEAEATLKEKDATRASTAETLNHFVGFRQKLLMQLGGLKSQRTEENASEIDPQIQRIQGGLSKVAENITTWESKLKVATVEVEKQKGVVEARKKDKDKAYKAKTAAQVKLKDIAAALDVIKAEHERLTREGVTIDEQLSAASRILDASTEVWKRAEIISNQATAAHHLLHVQMKETDAFVHEYQQQFDQRFTQLLTGNASQQAITQEARDTAIQAVEFQDIGTALRNTQSTLSQEIHTGIAQQQLASLGPERFQKLQDAKIFAEQQALQNKAIVYAVQHRSVEWQGAEGEAKANVTTETTFRGPDGNFYVLDIYNPLGPDGTMPMRQVTSMENGKAEYAPTIAYISPEDTYEMVYGGNDLQEKKGTFLQQMVEKGVDPGSPGYQRLLENFDNPFAAPPQEIQALMDNPEMQEKVLKNMGAPQAAQEQMGQRLAQLQQQFAYAKSMDLQSGISQQEHADMLRNLEENIALVKRNMDSLKSEEAQAYKSLTLRDFAGDTPPGELDRFIKDAQKRMEKVVDPMLTDMGESMKSLQKRDAGRSSWTGRMMETYYGKDIEDIKNHDSKIVQTLGGWGAASVDLVQFATESVVAVERLWGGKTFEGTGIWALGPLAVQVGSGYWENGGWGTNWVRNSVGAGPTQSEVKEEREKVLVLAQRKYEKDPSNSQLEREYFEALGAYQEAEHALQSNVANVLATEAKAWLANPTITAYGLSYGVASVLQPGLGVGALGKVGMGAANTMRIAGRVSTLTKMANTSAKVPRFGRNPLTSAQKYLDRSVNRAAEAQKQLARLQKTNTGWQIPGMSRMPGIISKAPIISKIPGISKGINGVQQEFYKTVLKNANKMADDIRTLQPKLAAKVAADGPARVANHARSMANKMDGFATQAQKLGEEIATLTAKAKKTPAESKRLQQLINKKQKLTEKAEHIGASVGALEKSIQEVNIKSFIAAHATPTIGQYVAGTGQRLASIPVLGAVGSGFGRAGMLVGKSFWNVGKDSMRWAGDQAYNWIGHPSMKALGLGSAAITAGAINPLRNLRNSVDNVLIHSFDAGDVDKILHGRDLTAGSYVINQTPGRMGERVGKMYQVVGVDADLTGGVVRLRPVGADGKPRMGKEIEVPLDAVPNRFLQVNKGAAMQVMHQASVMAAAPSVISAARNTWNSMRYERSGTSMGGQNFSRAKVTHSTLDGEFRGKQVTSLLDGRTGYRYTIVGVFNDGTVELQRLTSKGTPHLGTKIVNKTDLEAYFLKEIPDVGASALSYHPAVDVVRDLPKDFHERSLWFWEHGAPGTSMDMRTSPTTQMKLTKTQNGDVVIQRFDNGVELSSYRLDPVQSAHAQEMMGRYQSLTPEMRQAMDGLQAGEAIFVKEAGGTIGLYQRGSDGSLAVSTLPGDKWDGVIQGRTSLTDRIYKVEAHTGTGANPVNNPNVQPLVGLDTGTAYWDELQNVQKYHGNVQDSYPMEWTYDTGHMVVMRDNKLFLVAPDGVELRGVSMPHDAADLNRTLQWFGDSVSAKRLAKTGDSAAEAAPVSTAALESLITENVLYNRQVNTLAKELNELSIGEGMYFVHPDGKVGLVLKSSTGEFKYAPLSGKGVTEGVMTGQKASVGEVAVLAKRGELGELPKILVLEQLVKENVLHNRQVNELAKDLNSLSTGEGIYIARPDGSVGLVLKSSTGEFKYAPLSGKGITEGVVTGQKASISEVNLLAKRGELGEVPQMLILEQLVKENVLHNRQVNTLAKELNELSVGEGMYFVHPDGKVGLVLKSGTGEFKYAPLSGKGITEGVVTGQRASVGEVAVLAKRGELGELPQGLQGKMEVQKLRTQYLSYEAEFYRGVQPPVRSGRYLGSEEILRDINSWEKPQVVFLDMDNLGIVDRHLGKADTDKFLKAFATHIQDQLGNRPKRFVSVGGDEFNLLVDAKNPVNWQQLQSEMNNFAEKYLQEALGDRYTSILQEGQFRKALEKYNKQIKDTDVPARYDLMQKRVVDRFSTTFPQYRKDPTLLNLSDRDLYIIQLALNEMKQSKVTIGGISLGVQNMDVAAGSITGKQFRANLDSAEALTKRAKEEGRVMVNQNALNYENLPNREPGHHDLYERSINDLLKNLENTPNNQVVRDNLEKTLKSDAVMPEFYNRTSYSGEKDRLMKTDRSTPVIEYLVDINRFGSLNDALGYGGANDFMEKIAKAFNTSLGKEAKAHVVAGRTGGGELHIAVRAGYEQDVERALQAAQQAVELQRSIWSPEQLSNATSHKHVRDLFDQLARDVSRGTGSAGDLKWTKGQPEMIKVSANSLT